MSCFRIICRIICKLHATTTLTSFLLHSFRDSHISYIIYRKSKLLKKKLKTIFTLLFSWIKKDFEFHSVVLLLPLPEHKDLYISCKCIKHTKLKGRETAQELSKVKVDLAPVLCFSRPSRRIRFGYVTRTNSSDITSPETNWPRGNGTFWEHRQPSYHWDNILGNRKSFKRLSRAPSLSLSRHWMSAASCSVYCKILGCFQWYVQSCGRQMLLLSC